MPGDAQSIQSISAYPLDPLSARGPRLEGIAEVLGLTGNLPVSELHDTHRVRRQAVVCKDEFSDPKVGSTEYAPHRCSEAVLLAHGFRPRLIPELVRTGLATTQTEHVHGGGRVIDVSGIRITDAGRRALAEGR